MFRVLSKKSKPFTDQQPGTSGLRKKTKVFLQENYRENYIQAIFNTLGIRGKRIVIGGDGRYLSKETVIMVIAMAIANKAQEVLVALDTYLSTPAASVVIRKCNLDYGIILSASHNPGGIEGDFGIKVDNGNGAPLGLQLSEQIYQQSLKINNYSILENFSLNLHTTKIETCLNTKVNVINVVKIYSRTLSTIFDFNLIKNYIVENRLNFIFNAFNGVSGPYAYEIFHKELGIAKDNLLNIIPREDFGGLVPDPNPVTAQEYVNYIFSLPKVDLAAACDADGDRNMIITDKYCIEPCDSLAIIAQYIKQFSFYKDIKGIARSMPTSYAVDLVAKDLNLDLYIVPTGWKYFSNLLEKGKISLCGEESFGTGSSHIREKDGLWAILFWLNIMALTKKSANTLQEELWLKYGRVYFTRYDYNDLPIDKADQILSNINNKAQEFLNEVIYENLIITKFYNFNYKDPIDNSYSENQGIVLELNNGANIIIRLSGTGTQGKTIRIYMYNLEKENIYLNKKLYFVPLSNVFSKLLYSDVKPDLII